MKRYIVLLCLLIIIGIARANIIGESYISDFGTRADLTSKIWSIDVTANGYANFGAQDGMYQFDGSRWTRYSVDGETEVRSVNVSQKSRRIYAGSINEFGYFQPEPSGLLRYHSVAKEHGLGPDCGNIWGIFEIGDNLIAQGDYRIYVVNMKTHTPLKIEVGCKVNQSGQVGNMVYFSTEKDLQVLSGTKVRHVEIGGKINPDEIRAICDYGGSPLIITQRQGVWRLSSEGLVSEPYSSATAAAEGDIFTGAVCNQSIALGSINHGVSIVNAMNGETEHYDEHNGLNNNMVLALSFDSWSTSWTGLDPRAQRVLTGFPIRDAGSLAKKSGSVLCCHIP